MQKRLLRWELIGFAFTGAVGTLLHFVYEWTGGNPLIAAFCAVNESTWEHMKLLFVPFFLFTMVQFIDFCREPLRSFFARQEAARPFCSVYRVHCSSTRSAGCSAKRRTG